MSAFASNFKNLQHKSTSRFDLKKQRKCTSRSSIPFKEQLIWVHMDQTAFKILSIPSGQLVLDLVQGQLRYNETHPGMSRRLAFLP